MANGDLAAELGMDTVAGSDDIRLAYDEENKTRDYIAEHRANGSHDASQIKSGTLAVARGGTGRGQPFAAFTDDAPNPDNLRLLVVDNENVIYAARNGDIAPKYLGFRVHVENLEDVEFDSNGAVAVEHGAPFTPVGIWVQYRSNQPGTVEVTPRVDLPSWNATHVFLRAGNSSGDPYDGSFTRIDLFCFGVA